jgi:hypothetical protein
LEHHEGLAHAVPTDAGASSLARNSATTSGVISPTGIEPSFGSMCVAGIRL